jgi:DNA-binding IclR family transcriptional regulator
MDTRRGIRTVETGGRLLEALCSFRDPVDLRVLAATADLAASVTHAYLTSFIRMGLVTQDTATKRYCLGSFALELGLSELQSLDPIELALEALRELKAELGQTVALSVWGSRGPTVIRVLRAEVPLHATLFEGVTLPVRTTATGRVFAAFMPPQVVEKALTLEGQEAGTSGGKLARAMDEVRRNVFARICDSPVPGLVSLSAPVFNHSGALVCALTVTGKKGDYDDGADGTAVKVLVHKVQALSERLGMPNRSEAQAMSTNPTSEATPTRRMRVA